MRCNLKVPRDRKRKNSAEPSVCTRKKQAISQKDDRLFFTDMQFLNSKLPKSERVTLKIRMCFHNPSPVRDCFPRFFP